MKLQKIDENTFNLRGKLKEMSDYSELKSILEKKRKKGEVEVIFNIPNAKEINFYILGYWLKLAQKNNFKFRIYIENSYLYNNFLKLGLHNFFEVINGNLE
ncbi:hypothetical protein [Helicobacter mesocricetorum]|uniref:hypothetical protein n=1 Tax=Helicobacter mesocricetorum TaxID=87012 RepID=UPI000CF1828D|nr:hypothetical protein [Helicobacter mesocricetorum]